MTKLDAILEAQPTITDPTSVLAEIETEEAPKNGNGFEPGQPVGHSDFPDFRAVYVGPGARDGQAKVMVKSGWSGEIPTWPVTIPLVKLEALQ